MMADSDEELRPRDMQNYAAAPDLSIQGQAIGSAPVGAAPLATPPAYRNRQEEAVANLPPLPESVVSNPSSTPYRIRPVQYESDIARLRVLHDACFPIRYDEKYYEQLRNCQPPPPSTYTDDGRPNKRTNAVEREQLLEANGEHNDADGTPVVVDTRDGGDADEGSSLLSTSQHAERSARKSSSFVAFVAVVRETTTSRKPPSSSVMAELVADDERKLAGSTERCDDGDEEQQPTEVVVGFIVGRVKYIEKMLCHAPVGYIATFGVDPRMRKNNIGTDLLESFVAYMLNQHELSNASALSCLPSWLLPDATKINQIWLHCLANDSRIVDFYLNRHFERVTVLKDYYTIHGGREDGLIMFRDEKKRLLVAAQGESDANQKERRNKPIWVRVAMAINEFVVSDNPNAPCIESLENEDLSTPSTTTLPFVLATKFCLLGAAAIAIFIYFAVTITHKRNSMAASAQPHPQS